MRRVCSENLKFSVECLRKCIFLLYSETETIIIMKNIEFVFPALSRIHNVLCLQAAATLHPYYKGELTTTLF